MAWAQEMKNLAVEIKINHKDRRDSINEIKKESRNILGSADDYMKNMGSELREMSIELKDFLSKSEEARKKNFHNMIQGIKSDVKDIKGGVKSFIADSKDKRIADFKATMKDVNAVVEEIRRSTKSLLGGYRIERKEAAHYWAGSKGKEIAAEKEDALEETHATTKEKSKKKK
ncbi:MAG: hypothetical protein V1825_03370 [Candidatus Falkowbacteria bacterium]